jgi:hypothetical protein
MVQIEGFEAGKGPAIRDRRWSIEGAAACLRESAEGRNAGRPPPIRRLYRNGSREPRRSD